MNKQSKHSILIVDDEPDVLFSLKGLLRREFELFTAESGEEAMAILREHQIHVVMTDQRMPGMTGVELMKQARSEFPDAVRIVFTGYADIKAVIDAINSGGLFRYVTKPWDPDELIEVLQQAAQRYDQDLRRKQFVSDVIQLSTNVVDKFQALDMSADPIVQQAESILLMTAESDLC